MAAVDRAAGRSGAEGGSGRSNSTMLMHVVWGRCHAPRGVECVLKGVILPVLHPLHAPAVLLKCEVPGCVCACRQSP